MERTFFLRGMTYSVTLNDAGGIVISVPLDDVVPVDEVTADDVLLAKAPPLLDDVPIDSCWALHKRAKRDQITVRES